jgi:hypothetical protein
MMIAALAVATPAAAAQQQAPQQAPAAQQQGAAQQPAPAAGEEIVVSGMRERAEAIRDFIDALDGDNRFGEPLARMDVAPICPAAVGLSDSRNAEIAARIRAVATAATLETAKADCRPNVLVVFTRDKNAFISALRREHPAYFGGDTAGEMGLSRQRGPVTAWHVARRYGRDGQPIPYDRNQGFYVLDVTDAPSRISAQSRPAFIAAVVVIERESIAGLTPVQVADYAAMRAFTQVDEAELRQTRASTILSAIEAPMGSSVPNTLTEWDLAYLRGLAGSPAFRSAGLQRANIRRRMMNDLRDEPLN